MKKGLFSILAGALLVVGCQNYDDQFSNIESQITALASQVAGLSQVQSDLTALAGTVNSLQTSVANTVDAALADGLADIDAAVTALEAATETAASAEDVAAIATAVADNQEDLNTLITNSNFYDKDLIIYNAATLSFALNLGDKLTIVNGGVSMYVTEAMGVIDTDSDGVTDVQGVLNQIGTITGSFSYMAKNSKVAAVTFDAIDGTGDIEVAQPGNYSFSTLTKAGSITLGNNYSSKVAIVNLEKLTTVTGIQTAAVAYAGTNVASTDITVGTVAQADGISFSKATNIHLTALERYTGGSTLTLIADDEESIVLVDALTSTDLSGTESALNLVVTGSSVLNFSKITAGNITATSIANLTGGADHDGDVTLNKVENAVLPNTTGTLTISDTNVLETLHVIGALATRSAGATADTTHPVIDLTNQTALTGVILEGELGNVTLKGNGNLTSIAFTANADALLIENNGDLEDLDLAGTAHSISVTSNLDLEDLDITTELKTAKGNTTAVKTTGSLSITGNLKLASVDSKFDPINSLTISDNDDLAKVNFAGTDLVGAATDKATVVIGGSLVLANALLATSVTNDYEATAPVAPAVGSGTITDESGLKSLSGWLTKAKAAASSTGVKVYLDQIETYTTKAAPGGTDAEINDITWVDATNNSKLAILDWVPAVTTGADAGTASKYAWEFDTSTSHGNITFVHTNPANSVATTIVKLAASPVNTTAVAMNTNAALAVDEVLTAAAKAAAISVGVTLNAYVGGSSSQYLRILADNSSATNESSVAQTGAASATLLASDDVIGLTINGLTGTATVGANAATKTLTQIATAMKAAWDAVATSTNTIYSLAVGSGADSNLITVSASTTAGSRGDNGAIAVVFNTGASTLTVPKLGYKIGYDRLATDNKTISTKLIVTVLSDSPGTDASATKAGAIAATQQGGVQLTNTSTYTTAPSFNLGIGAAISDVQGAVNVDLGTSTTATTVNYLTWL